MHTYRFLLTACCLILLVLSTSACGDGDYRPRARGPEGEIVVVVDDDLWQGPLGSTIRETVGASIYTLPVPEPSFNIEHVTFTSTDDLEYVQKKKNVVIIAQLADTTSNESKYLYSRLDANARELVLNGQSAVIQRENLWLKDQMVVYVVGATPDALDAVLWERVEDLQYVFNQKTRTRLAEDMFRKGRQFELEDFLLESHDFAVNAQHDYFIAIDTTNFVWMRRVIDSNSWRSFFVYYEDGANPNDLTPEWIYSVRDSLTKKYIQGEVAGAVEIAYNRPIVTENVNFLDRYGFETRGLWHMAIHQDGKIIPIGGGGPFLTYAFYDEDTGRNYLIDGMIFAPNYPKREFLRQVEVIAHTFRTGSEATATPTATD